MSGQFRQRFQGVMNASENDRQKLERLLNSVKRRLFFTSFLQHVARASVVILPIATVLTAGFKRWSQGPTVLIPAGAGLALVLIYALIRSARGVGKQLECALAMDKQANLKDRISSALEFLRDGELDVVRQAQVQDAVRHGQALDAKLVFKFQWPRASGWVAAAMAALILTFFVPSIQLPANAMRATDPVREAQVNELKQLEKELAQKDQNPELEDVLKQLQEMRKRFEKGEISERDVMMQLARLDENLRDRSKNSSAENLDGEMNMILPHLMSAAATLEAATAIKENKLDKAAQEFENLGEKVKKDELNKDEKRQLAMNMGVAASKLGGKEKSNLGGDFSKASESLEKSDSNGFCSACKSIGDKLQTLKKCKSMASACNKLGLCKSALAQCNNKELGYKVGPKTQSKNKGGLKAGTAASGNPLGERSRLESSYRQMLKVQGQAGEGPVQSETEVTDGQLSPSQLDLKEVHANFAAVGEEAIEKEDVPLSQRFHVKRYFQAIRPQE